MVTPQQRRPQRCCAPQVHAHGCAVPLNEQLCHFIAYELQDLYFTWFPPLILALGCIPKRRNTPPSKQTPRASRGEEARAGNGGVNARASSSNNPAGLILQLSALPPLRCFQLLPADALQQPAPLRRAGGRAETHPKLALAASRQLPAGLIPVPCGARQNVHPPRQPGAEALHFPARSQDSQCRRRVRFWKSGCIPHQL